jgi:hypothetical protein
VDTTRGGLGDRNTDIDSHRRSNPHRHLHVTDHRQPRVRGPVLSARDHPSPHGTPLATPARVGPNFSSAGAVTVNGAAAPCDESASHPLMIGECSCNAGGP